MSAHVLLNLLNELGEKDKMRGYAEHLIIFPNEFIKFSRPEKMKSRLYLSYDTKIAFYLQILH